MIHPSRVLQNLRQDLPSLGVCLHLNEPSIYELVSLMGFDAIWMDLEHHLHSVETASVLMQAARVGGTDVIARPGKGEFMRMSRMLEAGAAGIMYPRCDSAEEAAEVVKWAKFAPIGKRGFDGSGADAAYLLTPMKEYIQTANDNTFVIIQVEEPQAVEQAEEILSVPGVDMLMFGPADFSVLTGIPGEFNHPSVLAAAERVSRAARQTGKNWAATCGTLAQTQRYIEMGCRLVFHGCDLVYVKQGLDQLQSAATDVLGMQITSRLPSSQPHLQQYGVPKQYEVPSNGRS